MTPDDAAPGEKAFDTLHSAAAAPASQSRLAFWVGADTSADNLLALQSVAGGYTLVDPQHGWNQVRRFDSYEAAYCWLTREAYEPVEQR